MSEIGKRSSERGLVILLIDGRCDDEHSQKFIRKIITERGLTAMRNSNTLLRAEQSRAEQSRAEQSRAEQRLTAPFLRLAGRMKLNTTFVMDNRRI